MQPASAPAIALSSWSVHRALGLFYPNSPANDIEAEPEPRWGAPSISLLDLPAAVAAHGIDRMQVCQFHLRSRDPVYLGEVRSAFAGAGVAISTLLIDDGDITDPKEHRRDRDWIARWIDAAAGLGAGAARVIAGKQPPSPDALARSVEALGALARHGKQQGVRVTTENWLALLAGPTEVHHLLDRLDGEVGFMTDFGNWKTIGAKRYDDLASVLARSEDTHAKAAFPNGSIDADDFRNCLAAAESAGYRGPFTLIYEDRGGDEWEAIAIERDIVRDYFAAR